MDIPTGRPFTFQHPALTPRTYPDHLVDHLAQHLPPVHNWDVQFLDVRHVLTRKRRDGGYDYCLALRHLVTYLEGNRPYSYVAIVAQSPKNGPVSGWLFDNIDHSYEMWIHLDRPSCPDATPADGVPIGAVS